MIPVTSFSDRSVALFGLGGSGLATARALVAGGAAVTVWDDNPDSVEKARAEGLEARDLRQIDWSGLSAFVLSPGVPLTHPKPHWTVELAKAAGVEIIGDIELFVRERRAKAPDCPFIAITGTNGKSTTTALIGHILRHNGYDVQIGGNIGTAVLTLEPPGPDRYYVVECSSYQIDLAPGIDPTAGILLNLTPDHLDRHGSMENYAAVKERLVAGSDVAIIGVDDDYCREIATRLEETGKEVVRISKGQPLTDGLYNDGQRIVRGSGEAAEVIADLNGIATLRGSHNAQNAAAAIAACMAVGLSKDQIQAGLSSFAGLKHRMQPVGRRGHVVFVNDSKATNAEASAPALSSYERIYWIAGGLPKQGGIASLSPLFPRIAKAYLIGEAASGFAATLGNAVAYEISGTLDRALAHASADAQDDGNGGEVAVMLSPACASFDQYKNFEVRGEAFVSLVAGLDDVTMLIQQASGET
ncbi:UDP-N-acetylmuramoylalanine--D-glutamate ligase [Agrobacterium vitis]|uniref:UDP-N-acetylmuramoyl-L-alanine--D-glutamate ligase n=1 Tax=Rhizobium/Agrobacterium group TaxID=227290 RepID=UPI0015D9AA5E|nr:MULTISPECIES: UDP-N-acetylmuramoyl-L-alanine--D-glutamate ligase [Rhizobium/Agrobacterium group]MCF1471068.1 UDP-N-acetylmuramoyl-L-alanine--D-glutamate ligase [Allorhizobium ampelinum]BCH63138.1 UDP-N-acetylmuramoylalanine--D-glutamate ligase [Agrobacterium vitis]